ncbi:thiamine pyrophosphate-binding protein [Clostridium beijerinckii]|uniref:thiamine pyrophosphate-binding protein n=1 Tax=Clostridium beijerinckii TaxID=1520 RepID=UPI0013615EC8|nr:thiamine pyrophosphate-binding protein [Clostridium beijerinckii]MZK51732.1 thiamine pyrophosphate-binding protein [Clostridium beijerinckii]MZK60078.1 thiamine pyrophosphate-binding protein [Clostridium beijerinckii]MZK70363.1 thiamine pyrophosphate-binding protein [Clostridium beijerinckii]MZK75596.1 thiamine pyrophosphate-binding protein [Clostridium beijerinckii]MZK85274.1 thiamine pyrophosphate-binding protein [Clostridium beijerinckii]
MKSIASILASNFKRWGVNDVFGIIGKPLVPIFVELDKHDINVVLSKHENGAGYEAAGYSLMNRRLGVAIGTSGPGGTNLITSAGQAKAYHIPVLFITGQPSMHNSGKAQGQDSTIFGTDLVKLFEPVTKFSVRVERADQFQMYLQHALEKAYSDVKGPVHLSIPFDVLEDEIEEFELNLPNHMDKLISPRLDEFINKLDNARKSVILAGKGIHSSLAYEEVKGLAEVWNIPVMTTPGGKGTFIENHPLSLGALGLGGTEKSSEYIKEDIDLMIVIGSKLSDMSLVDITSDNYPKEVVHLDYYTTFIKKSLNVPTLTIIGDIKENLKSVLDKVKRRTKNKYNLLEENCEIKKLENDTNSYISAAYAMEIIRKGLPDDAVVFGDDGSHSFYAIRNFNIRKPGTFFFDDVFGAMGHAIGYSIGAQLANYNSRIVCITGDGCTFMQGTEISTAANYNIPVTFIIFNNGRLDMPEKYMMKCFGKTVGTNYNVPLDGKKFGESLGVKSFRCCNELELKEALEISNLHKEAILIEVIVDPNEIPPTMKRR